MTPAPADTKNSAADLLDQVETLRTYANQQLAPEQRGPLGQYFTPANVATFLASFFDRLPDTIELLDPGAGVGMLTAAFTVEALSREPTPHHHHCIPSPPSR